MINLSPGLSACEIEVAGIFKPVFNSFMVVYNFIKNNFPESMPMFNSFGAPSYTWNSGRSSDFISPKYVLEQLIEDLGVNEIGFNLVASNFLIDETYLSDPIGNLLLEIMSQDNPTKRNSVICCDTVSNYVKDKYPSLKRTSSILKITQLLHEGIPILDAYSYLFSNYDKVMIHPDHIRRSDILNSALIQNNKTKSIIIINEPCITNCKNRYKHYKLISMQAINPRDLNIIDNLGQFQNGTCKAIPYYQQLNNSYDPVRLTREEFTALIKLGFTNFKIQGRSYNPHELFFDLAYYLFDDKSMPLVYNALF